VSSARASDSSAGPSPGAGAEPAGTRRRLAGGAAENTRPYDFRRPTKLNRDHVRTLQIAYETFARQYATLLTSTLRVVGQVNLISIEQLTYDEYVGTLGTPTCMTVLALDPLPGKAILEFSMSSAMATVDHLLGGPGGNQPQRPMTEIELTLLRGFVERVVRDLAYALKSVAVVHPRIEKMEHNPQFAQTAAASDTVIVSSFEMSIGREECIATLCVPFVALFPLLEAANEAQLSERDQAAQQAAARMLARSMENVPVEVAVRFAPTALTPKDLVGIEVGDVLQLRHPTAAPLDVTVADLTFARAVPGNRGKRLACLVVEPFQEEKQA
jgi:flagellar motor switch protein FliM